MPDDEDFPFFFFLDMPVMILYKVLPFFCYIADILKYNKNIILKQFQ